MSASPLLEIEDLRISFGTRTSDIRAVDGVDLEIRPGEVLGLVGESGSGKSVTARSIMRLVPMPPGKLVSGRILFQGQDLASLPEREMEDLRGSRNSHDLSGSDDLSQSALHRWRAGWRGDPPPPGSRPDRGPRRSDSGSSAKSASRMPSCATAHIRISSRADSGSA